MFRSHSQIHARKHPKRSLSRLCGDGICRHVVSVSIIALIWSSISAPKSYAGNFLNEKTQKWNPGLVLYEDQIIDKWGWAKDSGITLINLEEMITYQTLTRLDQMTNNHQEPHVYPCPDFLWDVKKSWEVERGWERSWEKTENIQLNAKISAAFDGIGSEVEAKSGVEFKIAGAQNGADTIKGEQHFVTNIPAGATLALDRRDYWVTWKGTLKYFTDNWMNQTITKPWAIKTLYKSGLELSVEGAYRCPVPEIDPAGMGSVLALVTGAMGLLERRRLRVA